MSDFIYTEYGKMSPNHRVSSLKEVCVDKVGIQTGPFGSQLHKEDYVDKGTPIITVEHLDSGFINGDNAPRVSDEDLKRLSKYTLKEGDIVFSRVGSVDRRSLVRIKEDGWMFSGRCLRVRSKKEIIEPKYLSYFFGSEAFKSHIRSIAVGATMPSINTKLLSDVNVFYPPLPEQKAIAHILGTLDDKIELNRQMNQTLEAMAQALFKSWFVDFDPVMDNALASGNDIPEELQAMAEKRRVIANRPVIAREERPRQSQSLRLIDTNPDLAGQFPSAFEYNEVLGKWIPEGWEVKSLREFAMPNKGKNITKNTVIDGQIPVVAGGLEPSTYHNQSNTNSPVITISASGANAGFINLYHDPVWSSDSSYIDNTVTDFTFTVYLFLKGNQKKIFDMQEGSAQPHIYPRHIASLEFCFAQKPILEKFELMMEDQFKKIKNSKAEIETLTQLRNRLLPELISGRVRVSDETRSNF